MGWCKHHSEHSAGWANAVAAQVLRRRTGGLPGRTVPQVAVAAMFAAMLAGCQLAPVAGEKSTVAGLADEPAITRQTGQFDSSTGCTSTYSLFRRGGDTGPVRVLLAHGFLRDQKRMHGLAIDLAERGLPTATLDLCNMRPWRAAVDENAQDLVDLATDLGAEQVVYAGFSAGGLAAVLAARSDIASLGVYVLDLVDYAGKGRRAAAGLQVPLAGLVGEPSSCNRYNEAVAIYAAAGNAVYRQVAGASHCDFESSTDWVCTVICDSVARTDSEIERARSEINQASLAAIAALANRQQVWPDPVSQP